MADDKNIVDRIEKNDDDRDIIEAFGAQRSADEKTGLGAVKAAGLAAIVKKDPVLIVSYSVCAVSMAVILISFVFFSLEQPGGGALMTAIPSQAASEAADQAAGPGGAAIPFYLAAEGFAIYFMIIALEYLWNLLYSAVFNRRHGINQ